MISIVLEVEIEVKERALPGATVQTKGNKAKLKMEVEQMVQVVIEVK